MNLVKSIFLYYSMNNNQFFDEDEKQDIENISSKKELAKQFNKNFKFKLRDLKLTIPFILENSTTNEKTRTYKDTINKYFTEQLSAFLFELIKEYKDKPIDIKNYKEQISYNCFL